MWPSWRTVPVSPSDAPPHDDEAGKKASLPGPSHLLLEACRARSHRADLLKPALHQGIHTPALETALPRQAPCKMQQHTAPSHSGRPRAWGSLASAHLLLPCHGGRTPATPKAELHRRETYGFQAGPRPRARTWSRSCRITSCAVYQNECPSQMQTRCETPYSLQEKWKFRENVLTNKSKLSDPC